MIDFSKPPKFEKHNHHFVPRFWQKHFCGPGGRLFKTKRGRYVQASLADTMTSDWTYLAFDEGWRPTDEVEDQLSQWEGLASKLIVRSLPTQTVLSDDDWGSLCVWLGLATSRHPNVLNRYKPLASAFTLELATAHDYSDLDAFNEHLQESSASESMKRVFDIFWHHHKKQFSLLRSTLKRCHHSTLCYRKPTLCWHGFL